MPKLRFFAALLSAGFASSISLVASSAVPADPLDTWQTTTAFDLTPHPVLTFGNGAFVMSGGIRGNTLRAVFRSTDGVTWTSASYTGGYAIALGFGNGTFVMGTGDGALLSSTDGQTWTARYAGPPLAPHPPIASVVYGHGEWLASTWNSQYYTSPDAVSWSSHKVLVSGHEIDPSSMAIAPNGTLVAANRSGIFSFDGVFWGQRFTNPDTNLMMIAASSTGLLAVSTSGVVVGSSDGINWTQRPSLPVPPGGTVRAAVYGSSGWVVTGDASNRGFVFSSPDGQTFTAHTLPSGGATVQSVSFGDGKYVVAAMVPGFSATSGQVSVYASAPIAPPSLSSTPVLNNPKPVVLPTAPVMTAAPRHP